jgi:hypothetical protein
MAPHGEFTNSPELQQPIPFVLHGSFGKHLDEIGQAADVLSSSGLAAVLAPHNCEAVGQNDGFVLLAGEEGKDPRELEAAYLEQVLSLRKEGGASIFVNPGGYVGKSAAYEAGIVQASGGRAIWTEQPQDVPFYVNPADVMSIDSLVAYMHINHGTLPPQSNSGDPLQQRWNELPFPVGHIAEGAIMRHGNKLLLVEDGRWSNQLTIPGTKVRSGETRAAALGRLVRGKIGVTIDSVSHLTTSFMIPDSGYSAPVSPDTFVFDDHVISVTSEHVKPQGNIRPLWVSTPEIERLIGNRQIEPNAAAVLGEYLLKAA